MLNCWNRPHSEIFERRDVYFDLDRHRHSRDRELLVENSICCVISYANPNQRSGRVVLDFWIYKREVELETGSDCVGLIGEKIGSTLIGKHELTSFPSFRGVLNADGDFNQFCIKQSLSDGQ